MDPDHNMYDTAKRQEVVDAISDQQNPIPRVKSFLELVHQVFPLDQAEMGPLFRGTHTLALSGMPEAALVLQVCWKGRLWPCTISSGTIAIPVQTLASIKAEIETKNV